MATSGDSLGGTSVTAGAETGVDGSGLKLVDNGVGDSFVVSTKRVVEVETVVETKFDVELVTQKTEEVVSNGGKSCPRDEAGTVVESSLGPEVELESGLVNKKSDEIVLNGDKSAPVSEAGVAMIGDGNSFATSVVSKQVVEAGTVAESSLGHEVELESGSANQKADEIVSNGDKSAPVNEVDVAMTDVGNSFATSVVGKRAFEVETVVGLSFTSEAELQSGSVQQVDAVSVLNSVKEVGVEKSGNGCSVDNGSEDGLEPGLVNQQMNVVGILSGGEANGKGSSIDTGAEAGLVSHFDDANAVDVTVSQLNESKSSLEGAVDVEIKQQEHGFRVGDFVWGKIKSHPWWPGQICDAKDASDDAKKCSHEGQLLVAFFGDGSYSWCLPSQLEPFINNFDNMSKGSQSVSFLNAIREAVNEIGRIVESGIVCKCIPEEKRVGLARPVAENSGIKAGALMPEVETGRVSIPDFEPIKLLSKLRQLAVVSHVDNALELAMMRSWLSACYRLKCGVQLPMYCDPLPIEGMEDPDQNVIAIDNELSVRVEAPVGGPADWLSSPTKTQPDDKNSHKRKLKSLTELIGKNSNVKLRSCKKASGKEGTDLANDTSLVKGKKSNDSASGKRRSKRKTGALEYSEIANNTVLNAEMGNLGGIDDTSNGSLSEKPKEIEIPSPREDNEAFEALSSPRERKKSKYLSPPYTNVTWRMGNSSFKAYAEFQSDSKKSKRDNKVNATEDGQLERVDAPSNVETPEAVKVDKTLSFSISDVDAPVDALLLKIQCAAVNPFYLSKDGSFDMVFGFCSAMRKSTYAHGSDYKIFRNSFPRKRKLSTLQCEIPENNLKSPKSVNGEELAKRKKKKPKTSGSKINAGDAVTNTDAGDAMREFAPSLIMVFKSGTALPSKEDVVKHYTNFGRLFEHDTRVMPDSQLVQIVFMKEADATKAFEASIRDNTFGFENLLCDMLQTSPRSRSGAPRLEASAPEGQETSHDVASEARAMASNLMLMSDTFEKYHSKFSEDDKLMLKEEMTRLKEKAVNVWETVKTISEAGDAEHEHEASS